MGRPRLHDEQTAEALLDAAEVIVAAGGPDALSVRRVADEAGTTTRAVYSLFESKDGLLVALGNRAFEILGSWVSEYPRTDDPGSGLGQLHRRQLSPVGAGASGALPNRVPALGELPPQLAERFRPARLKALADLVEILSRALGLQGGLSNPEVRDATITIDALCEGLALLELRDVLPPDRAERIWREAFVALISGMQTSLPGPKSCRRRNLTPSIRRSGRPLSPCAGSAPRRPARGTLARRPARGTCDPMPLIGRPGSLSVDCAVS